MILSTPELDLLDRCEDPALVRIAHQLATHPYYTFQPRPDNPAEYDEQAGFVGSKADVTFCVGGTGSGKTYCAAQKTARFLLEEQPPPKEDTPFWVIAGSFEQVCQTSWFQKLREIIPAEAIQHHKITWYKEKRGWPYSVPLKPWPDRPGKNWVLEFKSYEQGREQMQAASIGGAWFTEQFPWEILQEVIGRCRENAFPGAIFADFTPIDPEKSAEVELAYERWQSGDPKYRNWAFYRLNTERALGAGHVKQGWYDTFFASVSEEMMDTRKTGAFASYEGTIYQSFNPKIHLLPSDWPRDDRGYIKAPRGVWHRRAIDWGASAEHPFVCLWFYRNAVGQYFFYDEYWNDSQMFTALDHIEEIKERHPWPKTSTYYGTTFADPSRPDMISLFSSQGIPTSAARNAVHEGIECIRRHLKIHQGMGEPLLFIDPLNCPKLAKQMRTYRWLKRASAHSANPQAARPEPLKWDDDAVDTMRYGVFTDSGGKGAKPIGYQSVIESGKHGVRIQRHGRR